MPSNGDATRTICFGSRCIEIWYFSGARRCRGCRRMTICPAVGCGVGLRRIDGVRSPFFVGLGRFAARCRDEPFFEDDLRSPEGGAARHIVVRAAASNGAKECRQVIVEIPIKCYPP